MKFMKHPSIGFQKKKAGCNFVIPLYICQARKPCKFLGHIDMTIILRLIQPKSTAVQADRTTSMWTLQFNLMRRLPSPRTTRHRSKMPKIHLDDGYGLE